MVRVTVDFPVCAAVLPERFSLMTIQSMIKHIRIGESVASNSRVTYTVVSPSNEMVYIELFTGFWPRGTTHARITWPTLKHVAMIGGCIPF